MQKIVVGVLVITLLLTIGAANAWETNCSGGVLYKNRSINVNYSIVNLYENITCKFGCSENAVECREMGTIPAEFYTGMSIGLGIIIAVFAFVAIKMEENHWPISMLFMISALWIALIMIAMLMGFSTQTQDSVASSLTTGYQLIVIVIILFLVYFFFNIIKEAVGSLEQGASEHVK